MNIIEILEFKARYQPSAPNADGFLKSAFTRPANDNRKINIKQVNPAQWLLMDR